MGFQLIKFSEFSIFHLKNFSHGSIILYEKFIKNAIYLSIYLSKRLVACGTVYGDMHYNNRKSRASYPGPGPISSATWP